MKHYLDLIFLVAAYQLGHSDGQRSMRDLARKEATEYGYNVPMARMYADRIANFIRDLPIEPVGTKG